MTDPRPLRPRRALTVAALAVAGLIVLSACSTGTASTGTTADAEPTAGGTITLGRVASVTSFDLNNEITANNAFAIDKVFEPLVAFDADGKIIPWLASEWTISEDGLTYAFTLRDGVTFSDGTELTAADVVFSLERHLTVGGPLPLDAPIGSIVADGDTGVTITLTEAYTPFLAELSGFQNGIFPADFQGKSETDFFADPIGTGPFVVSEWDPAGDLTFAANENYWESGQPYIDTLVYKLIADDTQLTQQLKAGQINAIDEVNSADVESLKSSADITVETVGSWEIEQMFMNTTNTYFGDRNVRRAIALALDRDGITQATTFGTAEVANSLIPPTIASSANDEGYALEFDVDAAKAELAKSAYPDGFTATLLIASGNSLRAQEAQIIQESLSKIGITIEIESIDIAAFRARFFAYDFDAMLNSGQSDYPDPDALVSFQADPAGFSKSYWTSYENPDVTALLDEGRTTADGADRDAIYLEIQKILAEDVPYIPLFYPSTLKATSSTVHDLTVLPNGSIRFQDAWISE